MCYWCCISKQCIHEWGSYVTVVQQVYDYDSVFVPGRRRCCWCSISKQCMRELGSYVTVVQQVHDYDSVFVSGRRRFCWCSIYWRSMHLWVTSPVPRTTPPVSCSSSSVCASYRWTSSRRNRSSKHQSGFAQ